MPAITKVGDVPKINDQPVTDTVKLLQFNAPVIEMVPAVVPLPVVIMTLSAVVGTEAPVVAAVIVCEAYVPPTETTQVFTAPLTMVPSVTFADDHTLIPTTRAGDPTVVKVVPEQDAVKDKPCAADQFAVDVVSHVAVPPTQ